MASHPTGHSDGLMVFYFMVFWPHVILFYTWWLHTHIANLELSMVLLDLAMREYYGHSTLLTTLSSITVYVLQWLNHQVVFYLVECIPIDCLIPTGTNLDIVHKIHLYVLNTGLILHHKMSFCNQTKQPTQDSYLSRLA